MSDDRLDRLDYYTLLGVEPDAALPDIRRAFRAFAIKYHPDRFAGVSDDNVARATAIYRRGSEALEVLSDPVARKAYDLALSKGELRLLDDPETVTRRHAARAQPAPAPAPAARPSPAAPVAARPISTPQMAAVRPSQPEPARPSGTATVRTPQARAFLERALAAEKAGDTRAAWRALKAAVELEPSSSHLEAELLRIERKLR